MATTFDVINTQPTIYSDPVLGVVNGVLVKVTLHPYEEVHEIRVPRMDAQLVKAAVDILITERDALANLSKSK